MRVNRQLVAVVATVVLAVSACSLSPTPPAPGDTDPVPDGFPRATFTTPLEARDKLKSLDVFAKCGNPTASSDNEVSSVSCFFEEGGRDWKTADRQVWVIVPRGDMEIDCRDAVAPAMPEDYAVVTDDSTFVAIGLMNLADPYLGPDSSDPSFKWPAEVWPEDVARVLGGKVVAVNEWCPEVFR